MNLIGELLLSCQDIVLKPCETNLCKGIIVGIVVVLAAISVVCMVGLLSGEYQKRERYRLRNVYPLKRRRK